MTKRDLQRTERMEGFQLGTLQVRAAPHEDKLKNIGKERLDPLRQNCLVGRRESKMEQNERFSAPASGDKTRETSRLRKSL